MLSCVCQKKNVEVLTPSSSEWDLILKEGWVVPDVIGLIRSYWSSVVSKKVWCLYKKTAM